MNNHLLISIIINTYNYGHFIEEAINSVLTQTLPHEFFELIVVDDGSTDDTRIRVAGYGNRLKYIYKSNGGQASALNVGLNVATGDYVAFLDADDWWHKDKLVRVLKVFQEDPAVDVVYHPQQVVDADHRVIGVYPEYPLTIYPNTSLPSSHPRCKFLRTATSGIAWRRSVLQQVVPIPEEFIYCADIYLMDMAELVAEKIGFVEESLSHYRWHGENCWINNNVKITASRSNYMSLNVKYHHLSLFYMDKYIQCNAFNNTSVVKNVMYKKIKCNIYESMLNGRLYALKTLLNNACNVSILGLNAGLTCFLSALLFIILNENRYKNCVNFFVLFSSIRKIPRYL